MNPLALGDRPFFRKQRLFRSSVEMIIHKRNVLVARLRTCIV